MLHTWTNYMLIGVVGLSYTAGLGMAIYEEVKLYRINRRYRRK